MKKIIVGSIVASTIIISGATQFSTCGFLGFNRKTPWEWEEKTEIEESIKNARYRCLIADARAQTLYVLFQEAVEKENYELAEIFQENLIKYLEKNSWAQDSVFEFIRNYIPRNT